MATGEEMHATCAIGNSPCRVCVDWLLQLDELTLSKKSTDDLTSCILHCWGHAHVCMLLNSSTVIGASEFCVYLYNRSNESHDLKERQEKKGKLTTSQ